MFGTRVLFGGKVWKHMSPYRKLAATRKANRLTRRGNVHEVEMWLRKYNENPHNNLPQKKDWIEYEDVNAGWVDPRSINQK